MFPNTSENPTSGVLSTQVRETDSTESKQKLSPFMNFSTETVVLSDGTEVLPNQLAMKDGKILYFDGDIKLKNWIEKIIRTERDRFEVYAREVS